MADSEERMTRSEWEQRTRREECEQTFHQPAERVATLWDPVGFYYCYCGEVRWTADNEAVSLNRTKVSGNEEE